MISFFFSSLCSQSTQSDVGPQTVYNFGYDDERRALREELEKYRKDNEQLRQMLHFYKTRAEESRLAQSTMTMATSVDSALDKTPSGMSSTFFNSNSLQVELDESKERERKLQEQVYSLRQVRRTKFIFSYFNNMFSQQLDSSKPKLNDLNKVNRWHCRTISFSRCFCFRLDDCRTRSCSSTDSAI